MDKKTQERIENLEKRVAQLEANAILHNEFAEKQRILDSKFVDLHKQAKDFEIKVASAIKTLDTAIEEWL